MLVFSSGEVGRISVTLNFQSAPLLEKGGGGGGGGCQRLLMYAR